MTPSDWMGMSPTDWMSMMQQGMQQGWMSNPPGWMNRSYNDWTNMTPADWLTSTYGSSSQTGKATSHSGHQSRHHHGGHHHDCNCHGKKDHHGDHGCGCRRCGEDPCQCACCIGDVDFAVYSRVGEQRVIPIVLENDRRREKQVTLDLSPWTTRGGKTAPVTTISLTPPSFTLAACGEQKITLVVGTTGDPAGQGDNPNDPNRGNSSPDVDDCLVATADLRLTGCDNRSIRIAVALLPRDCDSYTVTCGCTCC
jgi:hypothetical protein